MQQQTETKYTIALRATNRSSITQVTDRRVAIAHGRDLANIVAGGSDSSPTVCIDLRDGVLASWSCVDRDGYTVSIEVCEVQRGYDPFAGGNMRSENVSGGCAR